MTDETETPRRARWAGLAFAAATALAVWWIWTRMPGWAGRLGFADLQIIGRILGCAAVFAAATKLEAVIAARLGPPQDHP